MRTAMFCDLSAYLLTRLRTEMILTYDHNDKSLLINDPWTVNARSDCERQVMFHPMFKA